MDDLFKHPLWMMWKYAYPKDDDKVRRDVQQTLYDNKAKVMEEEEKDGKAPAIEARERVE